MQVSDRARCLADDILNAYLEHDRGNLTAAAESLAKVYVALFPDISPDSCHSAGTEYFAALAIKDQIDKEPDRTIRLTDPRWGQVYERFLATAKALCLDLRWAYHHCAGYQKHKGELNYWEDLMAAETYFLDRVLCDKHWREKLSDGRNGPGPLPFLYMVSAECHDLHSKRGAALSHAMMELYFTIVLGDEQAE